jgi:hypothetical protein
MRRAVSKVRIRGLEYIAVRDSSFNAKARACAWSLPFWFSGKSLLPWNRRMRFQSVSPWRISRIRVPEGSILFTMADNRYQCILKLAFEQTFVLVHYLWDIPNSFIPNDGSTHFTNHHRFSRLLRDTHERLNHAINISVKEEV